MTNTTCSLLYLASQNFCYACSYYVVRWLLRLREYMVLLTPGTCSQEVSAILNELHWGDVIAIYAAAIYSDSARGIESRADCDELNDSLRVNMVFLFDVSFYRLWLWHSCFIFRRSGDELLDFHFVKDKACRNGSCSEAPSVFAH